MRVGKSQKAENLTTEPQDHSTIPVHKIYVNPVNYAPIKCGTGLYTRLSRYCICGREGR